MSNVTTPTNQVTLSEALMKVQMQVKDPLRKSVPDKGEAEKIQSANDMAEGTISVSRKIVDDGAVEVYRTPLKKLLKFYYDNTLSIGKGKQPHRVVSMKNLPKFQKEFQDLLNATLDGMKLFKRAYQDQQNWMGRQQQRMGKKFDAGNYPSVQDVDDGMTVLHSFDAFGDIKKSGGAFLDVETMALMQKQQTEREQVIEKFATQDLWSSILEPLQKMRDTLSVPIGDSADKKFHSTLVSNVADIANRIPSLNFRGDNKLEEIRGELTKLTDSVEDFQELKQDPVKREETADSAQRVLDKMGGYGMKPQREAV
tara:strand:+ start:498 stop:1433 length:936 start_codon:yes stop_codon:yes gene_type:complete